MSEILPFPRWERSPPEDPHYLTSKALAARWQYGHVESVYRIPASELPYFWGNGRRLYRLEDVERYEAENMEVFP